MELKLRKQEHTVSIDMASDYPVMGLKPAKLDESPLIFPYGVPLGVIASYLRKYHVRYEIGIYEDNHEKVISSEYGDYHFRRGGKNRSWLCYKFV